MKYIPGAVPPPPARKAKATMKCEAPVVCLVTVPVLCLDTAAAGLFFLPKAPNHFFRDMGIGSVDVCGDLCFEVLLQFGVLYCDRAAVFDDGRVRHSTCVVLGYSSVSRGLTKQGVSCFDTACVSYFDLSSVPVGLTQHESRAFTQQPVSCFDTVAFVVLGHSRVFWCFKQQRCIVF